MANFRGLSKFYKFTSTKYDILYFLRKLIVIHGSIETYRDKNLHDPVKTSISIDRSKPSATQEKPMCARNTHADIRLKSPYWCLLTIIIYLILYSLITISSWLCLKKNVNINNKVLSFVIQADFEGNDQCRNKIT